jgi:hypothetical protein
MVGGAPSVCFTLEMTGKPINCYKQSKNVGNIQIPGPDKVQSFWYICSFVFGLPSLDLAIFELTEAPFTPWVVRNRIRSEDNSKRTSLVVVELRRDWSRVKTPCLAALNMLKMKLGGDLGGTVRCSHREATSSTVWLCGTVKDQYPATTVSRDR